MYRHQQPTRNNKMTQAYATLALMIEYSYVIKVAYSVIIG